jgi:SAM-dependent methyltransferase
MANFPPLKQYLLHCVDELIARHGVSGSFLDAGCGGGDVSLHLARKGWSGTAIDMSGDAVARARTLLADHTSIRVERGSLFDQTGPFKAVFAMDVIEHLEDDAAVLAKLSLLLAPGGHLVVSVPSNPREWRWDDDVFGHYRRYTESDLRDKLYAAGLTPVEIWDFTFPVFWAMRRVYTRLKAPPPELKAEKPGEEGMRERTERSSARNPWTIPIISGLLSRDNIFWRMIFNWQFRSFRHRLASGHEIVAVARKGMAP